MYTPYTSEDSSHDLKVYIASVTGNSEMRKQIQRILSILDSLGVPFRSIDITIHENLAEREFMRQNAINQKCVNDIPLPPQIFYKDEYIGNYQDFDDAVENNRLEEFLKLIPEYDTQEDESIFNDEELSLEDEEYDENDYSLDEEKTDVYDEDELEKNSYEIESSKSVENDQEICQLVKETKPKESKDLLTKDKKDAVQNGSIKQDSKEQKVNKLLKEENSKKDKKSEPASALIEKNDDEEYEYEYEYEDEYEELKPLHLIKKQPETTKKPIPEKLLNKEKPTPKIVVPMINSLDASDSLKNTSNAKMEANAKKKFQPNDKKIQKPETNLKQMPPNDSKLSKETPESKAQPKKPLNVKDAKETPESKTQQKKPLNVKDAKETPESKTQQKKPLNVKNAKETPESKTQQKKPLNVKDAKETPESKTQQKKPLNVKDVKETPESKTQPKKSLNVKDAKETPESKTQPKKPLNVKDAKETPESKTQQKKPLNVKDAKETPISIVKKQKTEKPESPEKQISTKIQQSLVNNSKQAKAEAEKISENSKLITIDQTGKKLEPIKDKKRTNQHLNPIIAEANTKSNQFKSVKEAQKLEQSVKPKSPIETSKDSRRANAKPETDTKKKEKSEHKLRTEQLAKSTSSLETGKEALTNDIKTKEKIRLEKLQANTKSTRGERILTDDNSDSTTPKSELEFTKPKYRDEEKLNAYSKSDPNQSQNLSINTNDIKQKQVANEKLRPYVGSKEKSESFARPKPSVIIDVKEEKSLEKKGPQVNDATKKQDTVKDIKEKKQPLEEKYSATKKPEKNILNSMSNSMLDEDEYEYEYESYDEGDEKLETTTNTTFNSKRTNLDDIKKNILNKTANVDPLNSSSKDLTKLKEQGQLSEEKKIEKSVPKSKQEPNSAKIALGKQDKTVKDEKNNAKVAEEKNTAQQKTFTKSASHSHPTKTKETNLSQKIEDDYEYEYEYEYE